MRSLSNKYTLLLFQGFALYYDLSGYTVTVQCGVQYIKFLLVVVNKYSTTKTCDL